MYEIEQIINKINFEVERLNEIKIQVETLKYFINILEILKNTEYKSILKSLKPISLNSLQEDLIENIKSVYNGIISSILNLYNIDIFMKCHNHPGINNVMIILEELDKILGKIHYFKKIKNSLAISMIRNYDLCILPKITEDEFKILFEINKTSKELKKYLSEFLSVSEEVLEVSIWNFVKEQPLIKEYKEYINKINDSLKRLLEITKNLYYKYGALNDLLSMKFDIEANSFIIKTLLNMMNKSLKEMKENIMLTDKDPIKSIIFISDKINSCNSTIRGIIEKFWYRLEKITSNIIKITRDPETKKNINALKDLVKRLTDYDPLSKKTQNYFIRDLNRIDNILSTILQSILSLEEKRLYEELQKYMLENNMDEIRLDDIRVLEIIKDNFDQFIDLCKKGLFVCLIKS